MVRFQQNLAAIPTGSIANEMITALALLAALGPMDIRRASAMNPTSLPQSELVVRADQPKGTISREIYGHFIEHLGSCVYDGIWVGEDSKIPNIRGLRKDVVDALKELEIPVLRWPGGCFADQYNWKDGIGPRAQRPKRINNFWGQVTETNAFGTHEFMDLCELTGAKPYLAANVGSGTPREMQEWLEYLTFAGDSEWANLRRKNGRDKPWKVPYWGIGNESWGCGGNMTPEYYSDVYKQFATYAFNYSGNQLVKIACGASDSNYNWTEVLLKNAGNHMQGISLHYYTLPTGDWGKKGLATGFDEKGWFDTLRRTRVMDEFLTKHSEVIAKYDRQNRVGLIVDEWGTWYDEDPNFKIGALGQQNTMRDALVAAINLNIFNRHCDRVKMANIAQSINVLQSVLLTKGPATVKTPTYHVFAMYKPHMGATLLPVEGTSVAYAIQESSIPAIDVCASRSSSGKLFLTLANADMSRSAPIRLRLPGTQSTKIGGTVLTSPAPDAVNSFERPTAISPKPLMGAKMSEGTLELTLPPASVVAVEIG